MLKVLPQQAKRSFECLPYAALLVVQARLCSALRSVGKLLAAMMNLLSHVEAGQFTHPTLIATPDSKFPGCAASHSFMVQFICGGHIERNNQFHWNLADEGQVTFCTMHHYFADILCPDLMPQT